MKHSHITMKPYLKIINVLSIFIVFGNFLFAQEVCNDGIDNDGDGLIDCYDQDCYASDDCGFYDSTYCRTILPASKEFGMQLDNNFLAGNYTIGASTYDYQPYGYAIPKVADIDNDGNMEIVVVSARGGDDGIFIFDPINNVLKYFIPLVLANNHTGVTLANVDKDPYIEIIIATGYESTGNSRIYRYDFDGSSWMEYTNGSWPITNAYTRRGFQPDILDFNEDGVPELLFYGEQYGNKTARIFSVEDGTLLVDIIAQDGGAGGYLASHLYWKDHYAFADVIPAGFDPGTGPLLYADGVEFITGTRVYTIDVATGNIEDVWGANPTGVHAPWVNGANGDGDAGQKVALGDINVDGNLDIVVTGQGYISIWDPLNNAAVYATHILGSAQTNRKGGIACIGDVDGDSNNQPEIGVVSSRYVEVFRANDVTGQLEQVWGLANSDGSGETACNFFDFEGDGSVEMVYRDTYDLWVYEGEGDGAGNARVLLTSNQPYNTANGLITTVDGCSSGTGSEHPIIVDVDQNNRADIVVTCTEGLRVYRDRYTPWIASRGIFNQRSYSHVNINNDMTVPGVMQENHVVPSLNNYLTQMYRIDKAGNPFYPAPDFTIEVKSIDNLCHGSNSDEVDFVLNIFNYGDGHADDFEVPITFYDGDPAIAGARILKQEIITVNLYPLNTKETHIVNIKMTDLDGEGDGFDGNIYITINDKVDSAAVVDGSGYTTVATTLPNSPYPECDYLNNTVGPFLFSDCVSKAPSLTLDKDQSSHSGSLHYTDFSQSYSEGGARVAISDSDVEITDDGTQLSSAIIEIYNPLDGSAYEGLFWDPVSLAGLGISTAAAQGDEYVTLTGTQNIVNYQAAIQLFRYENTSDLKNLADRLIVTRVLDVNDGLQSGSAICHISMNGVNDAPTSADNSVTTDVDVNYVFDGSEFPYNDPDGNNFNSIQIIDIPADGTLYKDDNLDGSYTAGETVSANDIFTLNELYALKLVYVPTPTEYGTLTNDYVYTTFTFEVNDGLINSASSYTLSVRVLPINEEPTAADNTVSTPEDTDHTFAASEFNFSDIDVGNELYKVQFTSTPSDGSLYNDANTNGVIDAGEGIAPYDEVLKTAIDNGQLKFKPVANEYGTPYGFFNFKVHDIVEYSLSSYIMTINITSVSDNPVIADSTLSINENTANNTLIIDINDSNTGTDSDPDGETLTYTITGGNSAGVFAINSSNGEITIGDSTNLNYEATKQFVLTVTASDGSNNDGAIITINVNNVIESSTFTIIAIPDISINENTPYTGVTPVISSPTIGQLTYTISGRADSSDFTIDSVTGVVSMVARDYENPEDDNLDNVYDLRISATDEDGNRDSESWTVRVLNVNEPAIFTIDPISDVFVREGMAYTSVTPNITGTGLGTISFSISGGADSTDFTIDSITGVVSMVARNYEAPVDADSNNVYEIEIQAQDQNNNRDIESWTVTVRDAHENASFSFNSIPDITINENTAYSSPIPVLATGTPIGALTFTAGGDQSAFQVDTVNGVISTTGLDFDNPLDADQNNIYRLTLIAFDADSNISFLNWWNVTVLNIVESADFIIDPIANATVIEDSVYTSVIPTISGDSPSGSLTYSIRGGADAGAFTIDTATGVVSMPGRDYENPTDANSDNIYEIEIGAIDQDGNDTTRAWTVTVLNHIEPANFTINPISNVNINEGSVYTSVTPVISGDAPIGDLTYSINGGTDASEFAINTSNGIVSMVARDYENPVDANTDNTYEVEIRATDLDNNFALQSWTVTIQNIAEQAIFSINPIADTSVDENLGYTSTIPVISGTPNGTISYSISGGADAAAFTIDAGTGVTSMTAKDFENPLDANTDNSYEIEIKATDQDGNDTTETWTVSINNINEGGSYTINPILDISIDENTTYTSATPIITGTPSGTVTYSLTGNDANKFTVNATTGEVSMIPRDYENPVDQNIDNIYQITLVATDADNNLAFESWKVTINNVSEASTFALETIDDIVLDENMVYTSVIPVITGTPHGDVSFSLEGTDAGDFTLETLTGIVSMVERDFENPVDENLDNVYEITLKATDNDGNEVTEDWTITIANVAELSNFALGLINDTIIKENIVYTGVTPVISGSPVGLVDFELGGTDAEDFTIDNSTGIVSMVVRDYENPVDNDNNNIYEITLVASDNDNNKAYESWTVTIVDSVETGTFTLDAITDVSIEENTEYTSITPSITGTAVGTITYSLEGADASSFTIETSTGIVNMVERDFHNPEDKNGDNIYEVGITARDQIGASASISWTVTITEIPNTASPIARGDIYTIAPNQELAENVSLNDSGLADKPIKFTLRKDVSNGSLTLNNDGTFTYVPNEDYKGADNFEYLVSDGNEQSSSASVYIIVKATDSDGDGIPDDIEGDDDPDEDGIPSKDDPDSDGDDIPDSEEGTTDTDEDGTGNYKDMDSDDDGLSDKEEGTEDIDEDGIPNYLDPDSDGDGISDRDEEDGDCDNDGIRNPFDPDICSEKDSEIEIPQGFSPNNDQSNDNFIINGLEQYNHVSIQIFNRWGNIIFEQNNYDNNWDGTSNVNMSIGTQLPTGTYFFHLIIRDNNERLTGYIYLNR